MPLADTLMDILLRSRDEVILGDDVRLLTVSPDAVQRCAAICGEISQTMMPRKLTFTSDQGGKLVIDAGARRLLKVIRAEPDGLAPKNSLIFSQWDDGKLADQMKALGHLIADFALLGGRMTVIPALPEGRYAGGAVGFVPGKLLEQATAAVKARGIAKSAEEAGGKAEARDEPPPPAVTAETKRAEATAAMKAMIRQKSMAAAAAPKTSEPADVNSRGATSDSAVRAFFAALQSEVDFCAILNSDGNVEAVAGSDTGEGMLDIGADIIADLTRWRKLTSDVLSSTQIIVMRAGGIQNHSVAYFADDYGVAITVFVNTDLSRIFQIANRILVPGGVK